MCSAQETSLLLSVKAECQAQNRKQQRPHAKPDQRTH